MPFNHIGDITDMVFDAMSVVKTGRLGLFDDLLKIVPAVNKSRTLDSLLPLTDNVREVSYTTSYKGINEM
jgi:hypothetical protein